MQGTALLQKTVTRLEPSRSVSVNPKKYDLKRVAAYCRVSTDSEEQTTSYHAQKEFYTEKIMKNPDWEFAGLYADEGISGTSAKHRKQFLKMIRDCMKGKVDLILTKSVSRFARNTAECLDYIRELKTHGVGIYFEKENLNTLSCGTEMLITIHAAFAQAESESISGNVIFGKRKTFKDGKVPFNYKYTLGYKKGDDGIPEIIPEEAEIVRIMFNSYLAGLTPKEIKEKLNDQGVPTKTGNGKWSVSMVQRILKNEKYCGDAILQKTYTVDCISKKVVKNNGEVPMYYVKDNHPAIISREMFNKAQTELARRTSKRTPSSKTITKQGKYSSKYALTDILHCAVCGSKYRRVTWSKNGKSKVVWRCINRLEHGRKYCTGFPYHRGIGTS